LGILSVKTVLGRRVEEKEQEKVKKRALTAAAPPPTTVGRRAAASDRCSSQSEKMKIEREEKRAYLSRNKVERERQEGNERKGASQPLYSSP